LHSISESADGNSNMTKHVAAWDLPSLDYLSEEQTLKYLRKHEEEMLRRQRSYDTSMTGSTAPSTTSPSPGGGSLPGMNLQIFTSYKSSCMTFKGRMTSLQAIYGGADYAITENGIKS
jgi:hypothetical protein